MKLVYKSAPMQSGRHDHRSIRFLSLLSFRFRSRASLEPGAAPRHQVIVLRQQRPAGTHGNLCNPLLFLRDEERVRLVFVTWLPE